MKNVAILVLAVTSLATVAPSAEAEKAIEWIVIQGREPQLDVPFASAFVNHGTVVVAFKCWKNDPHGLTLTVAIPRPFDGGKAPAPLTFRVDRNPVIEITGSPEEYSGRTAYKALPGDFSAVRLMDEIHDASQDLTVGVEGRLFVVSVAGATTALKKMQSICNSDPPR